MIRFLNIIVTILIFLFFIACQKENVQLWLIETNSTEIINDSIKVYSEVKNIGDIAAIEYGITISKIASNKSLSYTKAIKKGPIIGSFSLSLPDTLWENTTYYIRAFVRTEAGVVFGNEITFVGNKKQPLLYYFTPKVVRPNDYLKIYFKNINFSPNVKIYIGSTEAEIVYANPNETLIKIPEYSLCDSIRIKAVINDYLIISKNYLTLYGPYINDISPKEGSKNVVITIRGQNFNPIPHRNIVTIGNAFGEVMSSTTNEIIVRFDFLETQGSNYKVVVSDGVFQNTPSQEFNVESPWKVLDGHPLGALCYCAYFNIGNFIYFVNGSHDYALTPCNEVFAYNTITNTWTQKKNFPGKGLFGSSAFSIGGKGYVGTGCPKYFRNVEEPSVFYFWEYEPTTDSWKRIADFPGQMRSCALSFMRNGKGYVCSGREQLLNDFWEYNPINNDWKELSKFPGNFKANFQMALYKGALYLFGNSFYENNEPNLWKYSFENNQWSFVRNLNFTTAFSIWGQDRCYIIDVNKRFYEYNIETGNLVEIPKFFGPDRWYNTNIQIIANNKIFFGLGNWGTDMMNDFWSYTLE